ncbi:MAG: NAD(FAD)-dependent dehydrogenase [Candidatus Asgardarchaeum californiense]|nr:MAG: NAD(FAD)-dependent dehydrogenase [Candidatus Asgardarchaeum californiense]
MSEEQNIVIIGCGAGGGTAAHLARKTDRKSTITILEKGRYPQYSKCALPYAISGDVSEFKDLIEFSEEWFKKERIDLFLDTTVKKIDTKRQVIIAKRDDTTIEKPYDRLIISTGALPVIPPIQNIYHNGTLIKGIHVLRTLQDAQGIDSIVSKIKNATIVGGGLIGIEMADSLHKKGLKVNVVESLPNILANTLDEDMCNLLSEEIQKNVSLFVNHFATKVESNNNSISGIILKDNKTGEEKRIKTDLLVIAAGTKPDVDLAKSIGCKTGETGSIIVNDRCETNVKNVYAVGDCTEYTDFVTNKPVSIGLGSIVVKQGIAAGINAAGGEYRLPKGVLQTRTSKFFGLEIAAVGPTSNHLQDIPIVSGKFRGYSLPEYFPDRKSITIKLIVNKNTGNILAAQAVGSNAALRINTFACAILNGMNINELKKLETAYAPQVAPTLDAITLVCDIVSMKLSRRG